MASDATVGAALRRAPAALAPALALCSAVAAGAVPAVDQRALQPASPAAASRLGPGRLAVLLRHGLERRLAGADSAALTLTVPAGRPLYDPAAVRRFYRNRGYQPAWFDLYGRPKAVAEQLPAALADSAAHGLRPNDYAHGAVVAALAELRGGGALARLIDAELLFSDAFASLAGDLARGRFDVRGIDRAALLPARVFDPAPALRDALYRHELGAALAALAPHGDDYRRLQQALADYRRLAAAGGWPTFADGRKLEPGRFDPRVPALRERLQRSGDLDADPPPPAVVRDPTWYDPALVRAVRRFQTRHGLRVDGVVAKHTRAALNVSAAERARRLALNLERLRWLPRELGRRYILVDIADYRMRVVEDGRSVLEGRAVVGRAGRQTPLIIDQLEYLVLSPYWYVPPTVVVEDKLPLLREDPLALQKNNIRVLRDGREIDPATVDWSGVDARSIDFVLRQDPGPGNALGGVKFMFPNRHSIYLHDTSAPRLFERTSRAFSSGCVRIDKPYELAGYLLSDRPEWTPQALRAVAAGGRERRVDLSEPVPVYLLYRTAWVDDAGLVQFRRDVYRRDRRLLAQFERDASDPGGLVQR